MFRKLSAILLIATLGAIASAATVQGAHGKGFARDSQGRHAEFDFEVVKTTDGDRTQLGGRFVFRSLTMYDNRRSLVTIRLHELTGLEVDREGNICHIRGLGVMIVRRGRQEEEIRGVIRASFVDRRNREQPDLPHDLIGVSFTLGDRQLFGFEGGVVRGDIAVFRRTP